MTIDNDAVYVYTMNSTNGIEYKIMQGNYNSSLLLEKIAPNNIFSLKIPPLTKVRLFGGDIFNYGDIGSVDISNAYNDKYMVVNNLPSNFEGKIRSISVSRIPRIALTSFDRALMNDVKEQFIGDICSCHWKVHNIVLIAFLIMCVFLVAFKIYC